MPTELLTLDIPDDDELATPVLYESTADKPRKKRLRQEVIDAQPALAASLLAAAQIDLEPAGPTLRERWGGVCRLRPTKWAVAARARLTHKRAIFPFLRFRSICLSCHLVLADTERAEHPLYVLARASDHDRAYLNHQIIVVAGDDEEFARNDYHPLKASW